MGTYCDMSRAIRHHLISKLHLVIEFARIIICLSQAGCANFTLNQSVSHAR